MGLDDTAPKMLEQTEPQPATDAAETAVRSDSLEGVYGSFWIDETEFAIPATSLQEVVNIPQEISALPLAPSYLKGLFNLRGNIIPLVDLRDFLKFPDYTSQEPRKVAIISDGELSIGLAFDGTGELLSGRDAVRTDFKQSDMELNEVIIDGVLKFDKGERLVQILDPFEILRLERVPKAPTYQDDAAKLLNPRGQRLNCISFELGHTKFALDLRYVQEVTDMLEVDASLFSNGSVLGTANLRGITLPIIDFRGYVGKEDSAKIDLKRLKNRKIIIMKSGEGLVGFMVFSIDSIIPYFESDLRSFAKIALPRGDIIDGCLVDNENGLVLMIDPVKLLSDEEFVKVASSCHKIYEVEAKKAETDEAENPVEWGDRTPRSFIVFTVDTPLAVDVANVSEVIKKPTHILSPPYRLPFIEGIIDLRGELITLINLRLLYGLESTTGEDQKTLIFKRGDEKYGILVDSVDEIILTNSQSIMNLPAIRSNGINTRISNDIDGCVNLPRRDSTHEPVMILNLDSLINNCLEMISADQT